MILKNTKKSLKLASSQAVKSVNKRIPPSFLTDGPFFKIKIKSKISFFLRETKNKDQSYMATECKTCSLVTLKETNSHVG